MEKQWLYLDKENYEDVLKYHGKPPCWNCLVRATCYNPVIDENYPYEIILKKPCDEANEWFRIAEYLGDFIYAYQEMPHGLLRIEDIEKIIQSGENEDIEDLAKKFRVSNSARDIKAFAVIGDDDLVFLDILGKIIQVLTLNISFNRLAIIKRDGGDFVKISVQSGCFNVKIRNRISELRK